MPAKRIGLSRAITQRSFRRGYAQAVKDVVATVAGHASERTFGRLCDWQRKVKKWRDRMNAAADEAIEFEPAPLPIFTRRPERLNEVTNGPRETV
jgi:hypothetical protein